MSAIDSDLELAMFVLAERPSGSSSGGEIVKLLLVIGNFPHLINRTVSGRNGKEMKDSHQTGLSVAVI